MSLTPASSQSGGYLSATAAARGLGPSTSTSLIAGDRRKIHTSFTEKGAEMVEEYDLHSDALLLRKLRFKSSLGAWGPWEYEVGEPVAKFNPDKDLILESSHNPLFVRQDTSTHFQFRIRNLPYPKDNYLLDIDEATQEIVLRTKNKKYYKRMSLPDLKAGGDAGKLDSSRLTYSHANNTLVISYEKPSFILELEARNRAAIQRMGNGTTTASTAGANKSAAASTPAQRMLASAKQESSSSSGKQSGGEFAGLTGLKGLANKDGDCKQQ